MGAVASSGLAAGGSRRRRGHRLAARRGMSWSGNGVCPYYPALPGAPAGAPPPISQLGARDGNTTEDRCVEEGRPGPERGQKGRREEVGGEEAGEAGAKEGGRRRARSDGQEAAGEAADRQEEPRPRHRRRRRRRSDPRARRRPRARRGKAAKPAKSAPVKKKAPPAKKAKAAAAPAKAAPAPKKAPPPQLPVKKVPPRKPGSVICPLSGWEVMPAKPNLSERTLKRLRQKLIDERDQQLRQAEELQARSRGARAGARPGRHAVRRGVG